MNYQELFIDVKKEFPERIALLVCVAVGIHLSTKSKDKDANGGYEARVEKKIRKTLWEESEKDVECVIKIWKCVYDWEVQRVLGGISGCEKKTFLQMMSEKQ